MLPERSCSVKGTKHQRALIASAYDVLSLFVLQNTMAESTRTANEKQYTSKSIHQFGLGYQIEM